jgi:hypothetical protein
MMATQVHTHQTYFKKMHKHMELLHIELHVVPMKKERKEENEKVIMCCYNKDEKKVVVCYCKEKEEKSRKGSYCVVL